MKLLPSNAAFTWNQADSRRHLVNSTGEKKTVWQNGLATILSNFSSSTRRDFTTKMKCNNFFEEELRRRLSLHARLTREQADPESSGGRWSWGGRGCLRDDQEEQWGKAPLLNGMRCNRETERRQWLNERDAVRRERPGSSLNYSKLQLYM